MIDLDPKAWKSISAKFKIKDNGLDKALSAYDKLADDAHDECLKTIGAISQLANALKKVKEVAAAPEASKYLTGLTGAADKEKSDVAKAKAAADKAQLEADKAQISADKAKLAADKAKAAEDKAEAAAKKGDKDDQDDAGKDDKKEGGFKSLILSMLQKVKTAKPDAPLQYLICDAKPFPVLMIARQINAGHKKILEKESGGSKRFLKPGHVTFEDGHFCFASEKDLPGYARKVQGFLKNLTGKKFPVMFGSQKATDDDDAAPGQAAAGASEEKPAAAAGAGKAGAEAAAAGAAEGADAGGADQPASPGGRFSIKGSVGKGGKNQPPDVMAVQTALNAKAKAGLTVDGKSGPKMIAAIMDFQRALGKFKPDGLIEPGRATARALAGSVIVGPPPAPPKPKDAPNFGKGDINKASDSWNQMLDFIEHNFNEVIKVVKAEYSAEHPTLQKDVHENLKKFDAIPQKLRSGNLHVLLAQARDAKDPQERKAKLQACKTVVAQHINYVKSEPLLAHIDANPWITVNCRKGVTDCLVHVAQAIGNIG